MSVFFSLSRAKTRDLRFHRVAVDSTSLGREIDDADIEIDVLDVDLGSEQPAVDVGDVEVTPAGRDHTPVEHSIDVVDVDVRPERGGIDVADVDPRPLVAKIDVR